MVIGKIPIYRISKGKKKKQCDFIYIRTPATLGKLTGLENSEHETLITRMG